MCGEWKYAGMLVERFAGYHRQSYACKTGVGDVLIGAAKISNRTTMAFLRPATLKTKL